MLKRLLVAFILMLSVGVAVPAGADPKGFTESESGVGFFYGTFDQSPNFQLVVGGPAEAFCEDNPEDPFFGAPGSAPKRTFDRNDGSIVEKINDKDQPVYLYTTDLDDGPEWIGQVCADPSKAELFASGTADLKVRDRIIPGNPFVIEVFNSVNGKVTGIDGTEYKVRASADLVLVDFVPDDDPENFVSFELKEIKRR